TNIMPPLTQFILPQNYWHIIRSYCRKTEQYLSKFLTTLKSSPYIDTEKVIDFELSQKFICAYINRLSDYLFTVARLYDSSENTVPTIYKFMMKSTPEKPVIN